MRRMLRSKPKKTVDDYMALPFEGYGIELIRGEFVVSPSSPGSPHQRFLWKLVSAFDSYNRRARVGEFMFCPMDVILADDVVVQPDILMISNERAHILRDRVRGAPDLAVEVISPGTSDRDRFVKRDLYERHGVREYWIVDLDARTIEVLSLGGDGAFGAATVYQETDRIDSTPLLAGLALELKGLWP